MVAKVALQNNVFRENLESQKENSQHIECDNSNMGEVLCDFIIKLHVLQH